MQAVCEVVEAPSLLPFENDFFLSLVHFPVLCRVSQSGLPRFFLINRRDLLASGPPADFLAESSRSMLLAAPSHFLLTDFRTKSMEREDHP